MTRETLQHAASLPHEATSRDAILAQYRAIRATTERLCAPLATEDYVAQSMPDASPVKWHIAHTTWFFETFLLKSAGIETANHQEYSYLFNSYYNALGERIARGKRGLLTRPTVAEVFKYREQVDSHVAEILEQADDDVIRRITPLLEIGLNHEQQHQELILTDLKHLLGSSPLRPAYRESTGLAYSRSNSAEWRTCLNGIVLIGFEGTGFSFDNESPRHKVWLEPYRISSRLVTNEEYLNFMSDGGYTRPEFWLSDGWNTCQAQGWQSPLYWERSSDEWEIFTLGGVRKLVSNEPVCHVSFYEADAFARWTRARLPTEAEWENASSDRAVEGNFLESEQFHPLRAPNPARVEYFSLEQMFGDVWEWTASPYTPYPGFRPAEGALGEYNGKFMCNQMVLRGGSCVTPRSHIRPTYRNFFPPDARWQFSGIRLADEVR